MLDVSPASDTPGPAPFACAYLNGRTDTVPPLLLALHGLEDIASLLSAATNALRRGGVNAEPSIVYTPDGEVIPKYARVSELRPNCVLVLTCGEAFNRKSIPERVRRMHAAAQKEAERLAPLVRAEPRELLEEMPPPPRQPSPRQPSTHTDTPWRFSPSGMWGRGGLEQRPHYRY